MYSAINSKGGHSDFKDLDLGDLVHVMVSEYKSADLPRDPISESLDGAYMQNDRYSAAVEELNRRMPCTAQSR